MIIPGAGHLAPLGNPAAFSGLVAGFPGPGTLGPEDP
jgi:hypothetical protein